MARVLGMDRGEAAGIAMNDVAREELVKRVREGTVIVLDVRPDVEYAAGHIPGTISMPIDELADRLDELPTAVEIVLTAEGSIA